MFLIFWRPCGPPNVSDIFMSCHAYIEWLFQCDDQTVEVKIRLDCEGCERKVKRSLEGMKGVSQVLVDRKSNKVTVVGYVEPARVLARIAHRTGKKAELWPYVPYDTVAHPYTAGVYDKKAPAGYVRSNQDPQVSQFARASSFEVRYTTAFSDENPTACSVMWWSWL